MNSSNFANNQGRATATCDSGDTLIEGIHVVLNDNNNNYVIPLSTIANSGGSNFADTYTIDIKGNNIIFRALVFCFDNPPAHIP